MSSTVPHKPGSIREMISVACPMVVSFACDTVMIFTDRLFLSKLGPQSMSAAMSGGLSVFVMMSFFLGLIGYATALVAQYYGAGRYEGCSRSLTQAFIIACAAYPVILALVPAAHWVFARSGVDPVELNEQTRYFDILIFGSVFTLLRHALSSFFTGVGRTRIVMLGAAVAMTVNVALNYVFVLGKFGLPAMGIHGAALGTIIAAACGASTLLGCYLRPANNEMFKIAQSWRYDPAVMKKLWHYGYPGGVEMFMNLLAFTAMVFVLHSEGLIAAAATTIVFNWDLVAYVPLVGIELGVTSLVGRYMGARNVDVVRRVVVSGVKIGMVYAAFMIILFVVFPEGLVKVFGPQTSDGIFERSAPLAVAMVRFVAFYVTAQVIFMVFIGALRGAGDTWWAMGISVFLHWLLLAVLAIMLKAMHVSVYISWMTVVIVFVLLSSASFFRFRSGRWKSIRVIEPDIA